MGLQKIEIEYVVFLTSKSEVVFVVSQNQVYSQSPTVDIREKDLLVEFKTLDFMLEIKDIGENIKNTILQDGGFSLFELNGEGLPTAFHRFGRVRFDDDRDIKDLNKLLDRLTNSQPSVGKTKKYL